MSWEVMRLAWYVEGLTPAQKAVLVAMADHADDDGGRVWPGVKRLAKKTSYTDRTVRRALADLREIGLIEVVKEANHHLPTWYRIDLTECQARQDRPDTESGRPDRVSPHDLTESQPPPDTVSPKPPENPKKEPPVVETDAAFAAAVKAYEDNIAPITPMIAEEIGEWSDDEKIKPGWIQDAVREAVSHDARNWKYVKAILMRWKKEGKHDRAKSNGDRRGMHAVEDEYGGYHG